MDVSVLSDILRTKDVYIDNRMWACTVTAGMCSYGLGWSVSFLVGCKSVFIHAHAPIVYYDVERNITLLFKCMTKYMNMAIVSFFPLP